MSIKRLKTIILLVFTFFLLSFNCAFSAPFSTKWHTTLITGYGITPTNQTQTVHLADTPAPGLDNRYVGGNILHGSVLLGIAVEQELNIRINDIDSLAGLELDYMRNLSVNGRVKPMYNVSHNFDELKYLYDIHTVTALVLGKLIKHNLIRSVGGYLEAGIGIGINRLSDYSEHTPAGSTASPMLVPYGNRDSINPAISAGVGLSWRIQRGHILSVGYRYFYTCRGRLAKSPVEQTNASIVLSPITYSFLTLSLTI